MNNTSWRTSNADSAQPVATQPGAGADAARGEQDRSVFEGWIRSDIHTDPEGRRG